MTREELEKQYNIHPNGMISSPGKFVGEKLYVPYFWDQDADEEEWEELTDGSEIWTRTYFPNGEDEIIFPELKKVKYLKLWEDDIGFVQSYETLK